MKGFLKEWGGSLVFLLDTKFASMSEDIFRVHTVGRRLFDWIYLQMGVLEISLSCDKRINQKCFDVSMVKPKDLPKIRAKFREA